MKLYLFVKLPPPGTEVPTELQLNKIPVVR